MGIRYILDVVCPKCRKRSEVYYAPTCDFLTHKCECGHEIDLEEYTGITYEQASNRREMEELCQKALKEGKTT